MKGDKYCVPKPLYMYWLVQVQSLSDRPWNTQTMEGYQDPFFSYSPPPLLSMTSVNDLTHLVLVRVVQIVTLAQEQAHGLCPYSSDDFYINSQTCTPAQRDSGSNVKWGNWFSVIIQLFARLSKCICKSCLQLRHIRTLVPKYAASFGLPFSPEVQMAALSRLLPFPLPVWCS